MTIKNEVQGVVQALFGAFAGGYLPELTDEATNNGTSAMTARLVDVQGIILGKDMTSNQVFVDTILANMGVPSTNAAYAAASGWAMNELTNGGTRADVVSAAVAFLTGIAAGTIVDSNYTAIATAFAAMVTTGVEASEGALASQFNFGKLQEAAGSTAVVSTFSLTEALESLAAANAAKADFAEALDLDEDGTLDGTTSLTVNAAITAHKAAAVNAIDGQITGYAAAAAVVQAAMVTNHQTVLAAALTTADSAVVTAQTAVNAVPGLAAAIVALDTAVLADTAAAAARVVTSADAQGATAAVNELTNTLTTQVYTAPVATDTTGVLVTGTGGNVIKLEAGAVVVDAGGKNTDGTLKAGVEALLAAVQADFAAIKAAAAATAASADATAQMTHLDLDAAAKTALIAVGGAMTQVTPAVAATPSITEISTEQSLLLAGLTSLDAAIAAVALGPTETDTEANLTTVLDAAVAAKFITAANKGSIQTAFDAAITATNDATELAAAKTAADGALGDATTGANSAAAFTALVSTFNGVKGTNPLNTALASAKTAATAALDAVTDFQDLLDALAAANVLVADLDTIDAAITAAKEAFTDEGLTVPVTLAGNANATASSDTFVIGSADATIANFGLLGNDVIFIGELTRVDLDTAATSNLATNRLGDANVLEVFVQQVGANTVLSVETTTFAGNQIAALVAGDTTDGIVQITLTGVAATDVTFENGFISVA